MGSGETAPTMAKVHRALLDRLGEEAAQVAIVDTPYGFQENADELSARTVEFFGDQRRPARRRRLVPVARRGRRCAGHRGRAIRRQAT